jgi:hypothetical protein
MEDPDGTRTWTYPVSRRALVVVPTPAKARDKELLRLTGLQKPTGKPWRISIAMRSCLPPVVWPREG